jgi:hypothetical protein
LPKTTQHHVKLDPLQRNTLQLDQLEGPNRWSHRSNEYGSDSISNSGRVLLESRSRSIFLIILKHISNTRHSTSSVLGPGKDQVDSHSTINKATRHAGRSAFARHGVNRRRALVKGSCERTFRPRTSYFRRPTFNILSKRRRVTLDFETLEIVSAQSERVERKAEVS